MLALDGFSPTLAAQKWQKFPYKYRDRIARSYASPSQSSILQPTDQGQLAQTKVTFAVG